MQLMRTRFHVANLIGARSEEVYFTAGGTESNNLVLKGIFLKPGNRTGKLVTSNFEHPAIKNPALFHESQGGIVHWLPTNDQGVVNLDEARKTIDASTKLVSVMHANNEIGTIQPIKQLAELCRGLSVPIHSDAAQSIGKVPVKVDELGVDFLTIAGHKLYAPKGIGALYVRSGESLVPSIQGAGHERGVRPGTENVPYIVGLGVAARIAFEYQEKSTERMSKLRDRLEARLLESVPGITVNAANALRLPNTSSLNFPGVSAQQMLAHIPELCVSTGAACHSDNVALSDTLKAIGLDANKGIGTVRVSCGRRTTEDEIDRSAALLISAWEKQHGK